jgi:hypothetical protein
MLKIFSGCFGPGKHPVVRCARRGICLQQYIGKINTLCQQVLALIGEE